MDFSLHLSQKQKSKCIHNFLGLKFLMLYLIVREFVSNDRCAGSLVSQIFQIG